MEGQWFGGATVSLQVQDVLGVRCHRGAIVEERNLWQRTLFIDVGTVNEVDIADMALA